MLGVETFNQKMHSVIEILKNSGINGCITGSCLLDADFDSWSVKPDIDVFVYGERYMVEAICILRSKYGFEFGVDGTERSAKQEKKKYGWLLKGKKNKKFKKAAKKLVKACFKAGVVRSSELYIVGDDTTAEKYHLAGDGIISADENYEVLAPFWQFGDIVLEKGVIK